MKQKPGKTSGLLLRAVKGLLYGCDRGAELASNTNVNINNAGQRSMSTKSKRFMARKGKLIRAHPKPAQTRRFVCLGKNDMGIVKGLKHQYEFKIAELGNTHQAEINALHEKYQTQLSKQEVAFTEAAKKLEGEKAQIVEAHEVEIARLDNQHMVKYLEQEASFMEGARECDEEIALLREAQQARVDRLRREHKTKLNAQQEFYSEAARECIQERDELLQAHKMELEELQETHEKEFLAQENYYKGTLKQSEIYENAINRVATNLMSAHVAEIKALHMEYDAKLTTQEECLMGSAKELAEEKARIARAHEAEISDLHKIYGAELKAQREVLLKATKQPKAGGVEEGQVAARDTRPESAALIGTYEAQIKKLTGMYEARVAEDRKSYEDNVMKIMKWHDEEMELLREALTKKEGKGRGKEEIERSAGADLENTRDAYCARENQPLSQNKERSREKRSGDDWDGETDSEPEAGGVGYGLRSCLKATGEFRGAGRTRVVAFRDPISEERVFTCDKFESVSSSESEIDHEAPREDRDSGRTSRLAFNDSDEDSFASDEWDSGSDCDSEVDNQTPIKSISSRRIKKPRVRIPDPDSEVSSDSSCDEFDLGSDCSSNVSVGSPIKPDSSRRSKKPRVRIPGSDSEASSDSSCEEFDLGSGCSSNVSVGSPIKPGSSRRIKKPRVRIPDSGSEVSSDSSCDEFDLGSDCSSDVPVEPPIKPAFKVRPKGLEFDELESEESEFEVAIKKKQPVPATVVGCEEDKGDTSDVESLTESEIASQKKTEEIILECKKLKDPWALENLPKFSDEYTAQQKEWLSLYVLHQIVTVPTAHGGYAQIDSRYATRQDEEAFGTLFKG